LEELVGLDISYHGGVHGGSKDGVKKEYVEAYNRHKNTIRRRGPGSNNRNPNKTTSNVTSATEQRWATSGISDADDTSSDPDQNQEAAMEEALKE
jgi:hypothetical protein